jgi:adenine-specific DNA-methyltransferase
MVQLPEPTGRSDFPTIAAIGQERIRRVIARMRAADQGKLDLHPGEDLGFRAFRLAPSNYRSWSGVAEATPESYARQLAVFADPLVEGWTPEAIIAEVALKEAGFGLGYQVERVESIRAQAVYRVSDADKGQSFLICLDDRVMLENLAALALAESDLFVCRDSALDDTAAANLALQCRLRTI